MSYSDVPGGNCPCGKNFFSFCSWSVSILCFRFWKHD
jgi:hypothetical protein